MKPHAAALRAIVAEFIRRLFMPLQWLFLAIWGVLTAIGIWLVVTVDPLWWLLLGPLLLLGVIGAVLIAAIRLILRAVRPPMNTAQYHTVATLVDGLSASIETLQTPRIFILFRVLFDLARHRRFVYLKQIVDDSAALRPLYQEVVRSFAQIIRRFKKMSVTKLTATPGVWLYY